MSPGDPTVTLPQNLLSALIPALNGLSVAAVVAGVSKSFTWMEKLLSKDGRQTITRWLLHTHEPADRNVWTTGFAHLIDRIFGDKPLSFRFILRSCLASTLAFVVVTWCTLLPLGGHLQLPAAVAFLVSGIVISWVPDYISLLVSRAFVRYLSRNPTTRRIATVLVMDTLCTVALSFSSTIIVMANWLYLLTGLMTWKDFGQNLTEFLHDPVMHNPTVYIYTISSLFTSFWLWAYVVSGYVLKMLTGTEWLWSKIAPSLNLDRPLTAIGKIAGVLVGGVYCLILGAVWIAHHW